MRMLAVDENHKYARDCLRWAARARTEEQRNQFLTLAHDWRQAALLEDVGLTLAYSAYAFVFGLLYDSLFPIDSERWMVEVING